MEAVLEKDVEVVVDSISEVIATGTVEVDVVDNTDLVISVNRKEFNIVGDELYIPKRYEDAPQWLRDLIGTVTEQSYTQKITELNNLSTSLQQLIVELEVAKNTYTQSIISSNDIDERINTAITTLNSSLSGSDATIVDLVSTKATPEEAGAIALNTISSSINDGEIGALVGAVSNTLATETGALANSIDLVHAEMLGGFEGTADVIQITQAYVGIDKNGGSTGTGLLADVSILQKQNDGIIETVTGTYDVMINPQDPNFAELVLTAEPYASWKAQDVSGIDTRLAHIGDVYIKYSTTSNGAREYVASYKFIRTIVDSTSPYSTDSDGFTWALIIDQASQDAYEQALNAYDLADNKRRVFTITPAGSIDEGDLWVTGTNPQVVKVYKSGNWELSDTQVDNFISVTYTPTVTSLQNQIDGKVESWYTLSTNNPKTAWTDAATRSKHDGDMWYQTDTKLSYYYSSSTNSWNLIDDAKAIQALTNAAAAQATADGVVVSYYAIRQDTQPAVSKLWFHKMTVDKVLKYVLQKYEESSWVNVDVKQGDTLTTYDTDTKDTSIYLYNSSNWVTEIENGIVASSEAITTLTSNLADTDFKVGGHTEQLNTVDARIADGVASVETKWAYNSTVKINGVSYSSGFGLATSLTSGSGLPTGQSEFWIKADKFRLMSADGTTKSSYSPFTVVASTGEITFNGKVSFNNVNGVPTHSSGTTSPTVGTNPNGLADGSTYYNTSTKSGYIISGRVWISNSSITDTTLLVPEATITSTSLPGSTVKNQGTIWRYQPNSSITKYIHYISNGGGIWTDVGGTYIDASSIVTGTIDGNKITAGSEIISPILRSADNKFIINLNAGYMVISS